MTTYRADDAQFLNRIGIRTDDSMCWHLEEPRFKNESNGAVMLGRVLLGAIFVLGGAAIIALWMAVA